MGDAVPCITGRGSAPHRWHLVPQVPIFLAWGLTDLRIQPGFSDAGADPVPLHGCTTRGGLRWGRAGPQPNNCFLRVFASSREFLLPPRGLQPPQSGILRRLGKEFGNGPSMSDEHAVRDQFGQGGQHKSSLVCPGMR